MVTFVQDHGRTSIWSHSSRITAVPPIEVLWQTAMEQAQNQLGAYKKSLDDEREKLFNAQTAAEKQSVLLENRLNEVNEKHEILTSKYQQIQTDYALLDERIQKKEEAYIAEQKQQKIISQQHYKEKDELIIKIQMLQSDLRKSQEKLNEQSQEHQNQLKEQRLLQERSENRWLQLIEQARQEAKVLQKELKVYKENSVEDLKQIRNKLAETQQQLFEKVAQYNASSNLVDELRKEIRELKVQHNALQNKLITRNNSNKSKKRSKRGEKLK